MKLFKGILLIGLLFVFTASFSNDDHDNSTTDHSGTIKRHKVGVYLGYSLIHEVQNTQTGKEQYVLAPTFGIDYEYWLSHKWAIGTYNDISILNIEVEEDHEEYIKRENALVFSGVVIWEPIRNFTLFAGTGVETDPHHTLWIRYLGVEYAFIRCNDWEVTGALGYVNKDLYDLFSFGVVIGRRFGKTIPEKKHH